MVRSGRGVTERSCRAPGHERAKSVLSAPILRARCEAPGLSAGERAESVPHGRELRARPGDRVALDTERREHGEVIFDGFSRQLPDIDPEETSEWLDSFDAVVDARGKTRGQFLMLKLMERAHELQVAFPATISTPYLNTIPPEQEPWFPGDEYIERRIRAYIRWNAAMMVTRANARASGIGGHLATYASSAALYEVGFNHFFKGKDDGLP